MFRKLTKFRSTSVEMALGSLLFQGGSFLALIILKPYLGEREFAFLITQISWASILSSVATLRLELLVFEEHGVVDRASLVGILTFAALNLGLIGLAINSAMWIVDAPASLSGMAVLLALGFGLIEAQSFLCVQMERVGELVLTRAVQAAALSGTGLLALRGGQSDLFSLYTVSVAGPVVFWFVITIVRMHGALRVRIPRWSTWKRGALLAQATLANTAYANAPVILAAASQTTSFVADFGFIMRLLTGPITFIRQAYGHTYLLAAFDAKRRLRDPAEELWCITKGAMRRSIVTYIPTIAVAAVSLFLIHDFLDIANPYMIFLLSAVTIWQAGINTVAMIRSPLHMEKEFFALDVTRVIFLTGTLVIFPVYFPFEFVFVAVSSFLYVLYILFIRRQIYAQKFSAS